MINDFNCNLIPKYCISPENLNRYIQLHTKFYTSDELLLAVFNNYKALTHEIDDSTIHLEDVFEASKKMSEYINNALVLNLTPEELSHLLPLRNEESGEVMRKIIEYSLDIDSKYEVCRNMILECCFAVTELTQTEYCPQIHNVCLDEEYYHRIVLNSFHNTRCIELHRLFEDENEKLMQGYQSYHAKKDIATSSKLMDDIKIKDKEINPNTGKKGWGGKCTCESGEIYDVGDINDCESIACYGGTPGTCVKEPEADHYFSSVNCGS